jgi:hypothetical protein
MNRDYVGGFAAAIENRFWNLPSWVRSRHDRQLLPPPEKCQLASLYLAWAICGEDVLRYRREKEALTSGGNEVNFSG